MSHTLLVLLFAGLFAASLAHFLRSRGARLARIVAVVLFGLGLLLALVPSLAITG